MKSPEAILLLSGGIDSTTLLAQLASTGIRIHALSFNYGQRHGVELQFAQRNAAKFGVAAHHIMRVDFLPMAAGNMLTDASWQPTDAAIENQTNPTYVPGRNLLMLSQAAAYAEAHDIFDIYIAANADDGKRFPDCSDDFFTALNKLWQSCPNTISIQVITPFINLTKAEVVARSIKLGIDLEETISCYTPVGEIPCGTCLSCVLRKDAIIQNHHFRDGFN